ncbi:MAG: flavin-dependent dehydrogenase [Saprospiraceae bacterium]
MNNKITDAVAKGKSAIISEPYIETGVRPIQNQPKNLGAGQPVIIGSGVSGMAISKALSKAGVDHVFIGPPPDDKPKLGESMDTTGTLDLLDHYPEYSRFYFKKDHFVFWMGKRIIRCSLRFADQSGFVRFFKISRMKAPATFLHVDRIGFDKALFEQIVTSPHCDYHNALVEKVRYNKVSDQIEEVQLPEGVRIPASYVFDATTHRGPVATTAKLKYDELSTLQMVSFAHFSRKASDPAVADDELQWQKDTNLVLLQKDTDDIDGFAWMIPMGDTISVGASIEAGDGAAFAGEELMDLIVAAYCRRGLHIGAMFPHRTASKTFRHKYFVFERIVGKNWLMAGPSACQVWFMSGAGVGMGLYAGQIAPKVIKNPAKYGKIYQEYITGLLPTHGTLAGFRYDNPNELDDASLQQRFDRIIHSNIVRMSRYLSIRKRRLGAFLGHLSVRFARTGLVLKHYCDITEQENSPRPHGESPGCPNCLPND